MAQLAHISTKTGSNDSFEKRKWMDTQPTHPSTSRFSVSKVLQSKSQEDTLSGRASLSATAFLPTLKTNFFGNSSASIERICDYKRLIMNKAQHTTRYLKHLAESANFKGGTINKHRNGLTSWSFEIPASAYCHTLDAI